jgi:transposase
MPATADWPSFCWGAYAAQLLRTRHAGSRAHCGRGAQAHPEFYAIEKDIRGRSAEERRIIRQQKSRPLADAFEQWLRVKLGLISQKGKLAEAIRYALSRWEGLTRFIDDGSIEIDNNTVERSIRRAVRGA